MEIDTGKLDLIVTHYESPWELGKPLFDMVAMQRNVNWEDVGVILVNDGEESRLPDELFAGYPYKVTNLTIPHGGVSRARNAGIDASRADWVMICDFDDQFSTVLSLMTVLREIGEHAEDTDLFYSPFVEEVKTPAGMQLATHSDDDVVFIHGKVFRRAWLQENGIRFCDRLTLHEDVFFVKLARTLAKPERQRKIQLGFWLWCWNDDSVGRRYGNYFILETYDHLMRQRTAMVEEYLKRDLEEEAILCVVKAAVDGYYDLQNAEWKKQEDSYRKAEEWVSGFLKEHYWLYQRADVRQIALVASLARGNRLKEGEFLMETITMGDWLLHLMRDVPPVSAEQLRT